MKSVCGSNNNGLREGIKTRMVWAYSENGTGITKTGDMDPAMDICAGPGKHSLITMDICPGGNPLIKLQGNLVIFVISIYT